MNVGKAAPWLVSVLLAVVAGVFWLSGKQKDEALTRQVAQLQKLTEDYNKLAEDANEKIAFANLPLVPVKVSTVKPLFADGLAVQIRNATDKTIAITLSVVRPSSGNKKDYELTIDGGVGKNIGQSEGWAFVSGDKVTITQPDHKPLELTIR